MQEEKRKEGKELNFVPHFAEALVEKDFIKEDIEKLYATNKYKFYEYEKQNDPSVFFIGRQLPLQKEELFRKLIGIMSYSNHMQKLINNEDTSEEYKDYTEEIESLNLKIQNLFKKAYKKVYSIVSAYRKTNNIADTKYLFSKVFSLFKPKYSAEEATNIFIAIIFFCLNMFEDYTMEDSMREMVFKTFSTLQNKDIADMSYNKFSEESKKEIDELCKQIPSHLIEDMLSTIKYQKDIYYKCLYDKEQLSACLLYEDYKLSRKDIRDMMASYYYAEKYCEDINHITVENYIVAASHMKMLMKAYNDVKDYYFLHNQETMFIEIEEKENRLKLLSEELSNKDVMLQRNKKQLSIVLEEHTKKNNELEKKIKRLEIELDKATVHNNELQALRELAFSLNQNECINNILNRDREVECNYLSSINVLVVAGNPNWQKKLKEKFPEWKYIDSSVRTFDKNLLYADIVVINTYSMNHSLFYFVMDNIDRNTKIHFVNKTNIDECVYDIYNQTKLKK